MIGKISSAFAGSSPGMKTLDWTMSAPTEAEPPVPPPVVPPVVVVVLAPVLTTPL